MLVVCPHEWITGRRRRSLVVIAVGGVTLPHQRASETVGVGRRQDAGCRKQSSASETSNCTERCTMDHPCMTCSFPSVPAV